MVRKEGDRTMMIFRVVPVEPVETVENVLASTIMSVFGELGLHWVYFGRNYIDWVELLNAQKN